MDRERLDALWDRHLAGESLSPAEEQDLLQAMSAADDLRDDLLDEEQIDLTLAALGRSSSDGEEFVKSFVHQRALEGDKANFVGEFKARMARRAPAPRRGLWMFLAAAAALIAITLGTVLVFTREAPSPTPPRIANLRGTVLRLPERVAVTADQELLPGQGLETPGAASGAELVFPDGTRLTLDGDTTLSRVEDIGRGKQVSLSKGDLRAVVSPQPSGRPMVFSTPQGAATVLGTTLRIRMAPDGTNTRLDVETGKVELKNLDGRSVLVVSGHRAVAAAGVELVARPMASSSYSLRFALREEGTPPFALTAFGGNTVRFSPDGRLLAATLGGDGPLRLWEVASGRLRRSITAKEEVFRSVAFSRDGTRLYAGSDGRQGGLRTWEVETGLRIEELSTHQARPLALSPDGKTLATGGFRGVSSTFELTDIATSTSRPLSGLNDVIHCTAFSPDGRLVAAGGREHTAKWWDVATGQELGSGVQEVHHVVTMAFSTDGSMLATAGGQGGTGPYLQFWDVRTSRPRPFVKETPRKDIYAVAFSPDGSTFAAGYDDGAIDLWDTETREKVVTLREGRGPIFAMDFAPDSRSLAALGGDGTLRLWGSSRTR